MALTHRLDVCWLCEEPMDESKEHILPQAVTYDSSLQVTGFICTRCNNRTGTEWDAHLAKACHLKFRQDQNYLVNLRESGRSRIPTDFITFDGEVIEGSTDRESNFYERRRKPLETDLGNGYVRVSLQGSAGDKKLWEQMDNVRKRFRGPTLENMSTEVVFGVPSHEVEISRNNVRKSLIKSYMALAYHVGIDPNICDASIPYMRDETSECFLLEPPILMLRELYVGYRHVVMIYNLGHFLVGSAHISGFPWETRRATLGGEQFVECLVPALMSRQYDGPPIMKAYVVNVKDKGHEVLDIKGLIDDGTIGFNPRQP